MFSSTQTLKTSKVEDQKLSEMEFFLCVQLMSYLSDAYVEYYLFFVFSGL